MPKADGTILVQAKVDQAQAQKALNQLNREISKTEKNIESLKNKRADISKQFEQASDAAKAAGEKVEQMKQGLAEAKAEVQKGVDLPLDDVMKYQEIIDIAPQKIKEQEQEYQKLTAKAEELNAELEKYNEQITESTNNLSQQQAAAGEQVRIISDTSKVIEEETARAQRAAERQERMAKALSMVQAAGQAAAGALRAGGRAMLSFLGHMNVFSKLASGLSGKISRLGTMIKQAFVFNVISQGLNALRNQISAYLSTNAAFAGALNNLKASLSTAFQPILTAAVPALVTLMNVLASVINVIGRFIAALASIGGKGAKSSTKAMQAEAAAIGGAGGAAAEASKSLAKFDEINKLSDNSGGGGGGGGGGGVGADEIPEYDLGTTFNTWGEAFNAFLDTILNDGIPRLREGLSGFAVWLNGLSANLYEMFTFPGVQEKVRLIGKELAFAFNDLTNEIDWSVLGAALGAGLNTALGLLVSYIYNYDWIMLGLRLSQMFNSMVGEINWYEFGQLLWSGFKIGLETLAGFLMGLNMPQLGQAASQIVIGFFNSITETVNNIQWYQIGQQIGTFFANIDWPGMLEAGKTALLTAVQGLLDMLNGFIEESPPELIAAIAIAIASTFVGAKVKLAAAFVLLFALLKDKMFEIGSTIANAINKIDFAQVMTNLGKLLSDAVSGALNLLIGFISTLDWVNLGKELFHGFVGAVTSIDWGGIVVKIFELLAAAIVGVNLAMISFAKELWDGIVEAIQSVGDSFSKLFEMSGEEVWNGICQGIVNAASGIWSWIKANIFQPFMDGFKSIFGIHSPSTVMSEQGGFIIKGLLQGITQAWGSITQFFSGKLNAVKNTITNAWRSIKTTASTWWNNIKTTVGGVWDNIKGAAETKFGEVKSAIGTAWENVKTTTGTIWDNVTASLGGWWNNLKSNASSKFTEMKNSISEAWSQTQSKTTSTWSSISNGLNTTWKSIDSSAKTKFGKDIKGDITGAWSASQKSTTQTWQAISTGLKQTWSTLQLDASDKFGKTKTAVTDAWNASKQKSDEVWGPLKTDVTGAFQAIKDSAATSFSSAQASASGAFATMSNNIRGSVNDIISSINRMTSNVASGVSSALSAISNLRNASANVSRSVASGIASIPIPKLASGAVIPPNREFLAVLGDQRSGTNVEAPLSTIKQAVAEVLSQMGGVGGGEQTVILQLDRQVLGQVVYTLNDEQTRRIGVSLKGVAT